MGYSVDEGAPSFNTIRARHGTFLAGIRAGGLGRNGRLGGRFFPILQSFRDSQSAANSQERWAFFAASEVKRIAHAPSVNVTKSVLDPPAVCPRVSSDNKGMLLCY
jgi:hypothetical protein